MTAARNLFGRIGTRTGVAAVLVAGAGLGLAGQMAYTATTGSTTNTITACVKQDNTWKLAPQSGGCPTDSTPLTWNVQGIPGAAGTPGAAGAPGAQGPAGAPGAAAPDTRPNRHVIGNITIAGVNGGNPIDIYSFSWGAVAQVTNSGGPGGGRTAGSPNFDDVHFTKQTDGSSPTLLLALAEGRSIQTATLTLFNSSGATALTIKMDSVFVTLDQDENNGANDSNLFENVSLDFGRVDVIAPTNGGSPNEIEYNIAGNNAG